MTPAPRSSDSAKPAPTTGLWWPKDLPRWAARAFQPLRTLSLLVGPCAQSQMAFNRQMLPKPQSRACKLPQVPTHASTVRSLSQLAAATEGTFVPDAREAFKRRTRQAWVPRTFLKRRWILPRPKPRSTLPSRAGSTTSSRPL